MHALPVLYGSYTTPMNCNRDFIMHSSHWSLANWSFLMSNVAY